MRARYRVTKVFTAGPHAGQSVEFTTAVEFRRGDSVKFPARGYAFRIERVEKLATSRHVPEAATPAPTPERPRPAVRELSEVQRIYGELRKEWQESNGPIIAVRRRSWQLLGGQHFKARYRKEFAEGDVAAIPGLDDVAQSIACEFGFVRSADELFEILKQSSPEAPSREELMETARKFAESAVAVDDDISFNFGHNVTF